MLTPSFAVVHDDFARYVHGNVHLETLYTGCRWAEGPAYFAAGRYLVWSDIPNNRMLRWDECSGAVSVFRQPSMHANGHTVDGQGRLVSCEHQGRCVSRTEHDGRRTVLASHVDGKRLNSPNDVVVKSDGSVWFTDPTYGIDSDYEGDAAPSEIGASHVKGGPRHIRRFEVDGDRLRGGEVFATCTDGFFDGFRLDVHGNVWTSAGHGVHCYAPDGRLLGKICVPEVVANVCFGGPKRNRLFICGTTSLYAVYLNTQGATWPGVSNP